MKKIILLGLSVLMLASCTDLLETEPGGSTVTQDQIDEMSKTAPENLVAASVNAIYASFKAMTPVTGEDHNDFGYPSIMMISDCNGMDEISAMTGYNWNRQDLLFSDRLYTSSESEIVWNTLYQMIFAVNNVMGKLDPESTDPTIKFYSGNAKAARAFAYFNLAQLYQFTYVDNKTQPCVPIITEENMADALENGCKRATVQEVYDLILSDLDDAIEEIGYAQDNNFERADRRYIDLAVAYGLRARVNLTMQNWSGAAEDAQAAIDNTDAYPSSLELASRPAFWSIKECDWMWGVLVDETDEIVASQIVNYASHMGSFNFGYCWYSGGRQINQLLYDYIPDSDVRKGWWTDEDCLSKNLTDMENYLMSDPDEGFGYPPYTQVKFAPYKEELFTDLNANDIPLMRVEEMYYILAEAKAMAGNIPDALTDLNDFVSTYRDSLYECTLATAQDIQDEIWYQRRVEFWGEGLSWFDIMRLKKGVDRRDAGFPAASTVFNIAPDDPILLWRLPQSEIEANKLISALDNNPSAPAPKPVSGEEGGDEEGDE